MGVEKYATFIRQKHVERVLRFIREKKTKMFRCISRSWICILYIGLITLENHILLLLFFCLNFCFYYAVIEIANKILPRFFRIPIEVSKKKIFKKKYLQENHVHNLFNINTCSANFYQFINFSLNQQVYIHICIYILNSSPCQSLMLRRTLLLSLFALFKRSYTMSKILFVCSISFIILLYCFFKC